MTLGTTALALGILSGFRHAFEPDHLSAVSTLVVDRPHPLKAARLGAWWGLGHTAALVGVGALLTLVDGSLPPRLGDMFELLVASMLFFLGAKAIRRAWAAGAMHPAARQAAWVRLHQHSGLNEHLHVGRSTLALRPLAVGIVHGLAGSGALAALAMSTLPSPLLRVSYALLFGLASSVGMALVSGLAGLSMARVSRSAQAVRMMSVCTGVLSIGVGSLWAAPILRTWMSR